MLFNSYGFIFVFLPITLIGYFILNKKRLTIASKAFLVLASLFFYSYWNIKYLPILLTSIVFNYSIGLTLSKIQDTVNSKLNRKVLLIVGITGDLALLGFFKYYDFFANNVNAIIGDEIKLLHLALPLGISFFTFTQIAYLVDAYKGKVKKMGYLNYSLFVTFFPHLIAGPIIHHKEMMPQFDNLRTKVFNYKNFSSGIFLFAIGLFKKVIIADTLAKYANIGFSMSLYPKLFEAWAISLSYNFQIYFDFSGYTDMALGAALMCNICLPINFNSPYKSSNIQDFWRRWHVTLSRFLRDYIYIPLGGNKTGEFNTYRNLIITFLLGGLWHGAGWTFIIWGAWHGLAMVIHRAWTKLNFRMNRILAWFITFNFVNITWVFFRAKKWEDAIRIIKGMFGLNGIVLPHPLEAKLAFLNGYGFTFGEAFANILGKGIGIKMILTISISFGIAIFAKNSSQMMSSFKPKFKSMVFIGILICLAILSLNKVSAFLYFNF